MAEDKLSKEDLKKVLQKEKKTPSNPNTQTPHRRENKIKFKKAKNSPKVEQKR